jgi:hypothetical protein
VDGIGGSSQQELLGSQNAALAAPFPIDELGSGMRTFFDPLVGRDGPSVAIAGQLLGKPRSAQ